MDVRDLHKTLRIDVDGLHTIGEVVEQITERLGLPSDRSYRLLCGKEVFLVPNRKHLTMSDVGVKSGDRLVLASEVTEAASPIPTQLSPTVLFSGARPEKGGTEVVPRVPESNKTWTDIGAKGGDEYYLSFIRKTASHMPRPNIATDWDWPMVIGLGMIAGAVLPLVLLLLRPQVPTGVSPAVYSYVLRAILVSFLLLVGGFLATMVGMHRLSQARQPKTFIPGPKLCATCGSNVSPDSLSCAKCGTRLAGEQLP